MSAYLPFTSLDLPLLDAQALADLQALAAESIGWQPLGAGAYLHYGDAGGEENVIHVVGIPDTTLTGLNALLLT